MGFNLLNVFGKKKPIALTPQQWGYQHFNNVPVAAWGNNEDAVDEGFCKNDAVYSIVSKIAKVAAKAPFAEYQVKDEKVYKDYKYALENYKKEGVKRHDLITLQSKSIEPVQGNFTKVYTNPNENTSAWELTEQSVIYRLITGNNYEYYLRAASNKRPLEVYTLPAQMMKIVASGVETFPKQIVAYELQDGTIRRFSKDEVSHTKKVNLQWNQNGAQLYGMSPLQSAWLTLNGDNEANKYSAEEAKNKGALGIFTFTSPAVGNDQTKGEAFMGQIKDKFYNDYQKAYVGTVMPLYGEGQWHPIGLSSTDMQILEKGRWSLKRLCNIYGVSDILFNGESNATYDNFNTATIELITNAVMPELLALRDGRQRYAKANNMLPAGRVIDFDATIYTELDADKKDLVEWMKQIPFTMNQRLIYIGEEPVQGLPYMDIPMIHKDYMPVELLGKKTATSTNEN